MILCHLLIGHNYMIKLSYMLCFTCISDVCLNNENLIAVLTSTPGMVMGSFKSELCSHVHFIRSYRKSTLVSWNCPEVRTRFFIETRFEVTFGLFFMSFEKSRNHQNTSVSTSIIKNRVLVCAYSSEKIRYNKFINNDNIFSKIKWLPISADSLHNFSSHILFKINCNSTIMKSS